MWKRWVIRSRKEEREEKEMLVMSVYTKPLSILSEELSPKMHLGLRLCDTHSFYINMTECFTHESKSLRWLKDILIDLCSHDL